MEAGGNKKICSIHTVLCVYQYKNISNIHSNTNEIALSDADFQQISVQSKRAPGYRQSVRFGPVKACTWVPSKRAPVQSKRAPQQSYPQLWEREIELIGNQSKLESFSQVTLKFF
jgi:hypothetical protein